MTRVRENIAWRGKFGNKQLIRSLSDLKAPLQIQNYKIMLKSCQLTVITDLTPGTAIDRTENALRIFDL